MAVAALVGCYVAVATGTTSGTAPGGVVPPTGCTLTSPSDLSAFATDVETGIDVDTKDVTAFGSGGYAAFVAGIKKGKVAISFLQDYAASGPNQVLGMNGTVAAPGAFFFIEVRPSSGARSASNPGLIAKVLHNAWRPMKAKIGDVPTVDVDLSVTGGFAELIA